jgi:hypothetical protein
MDEVQIFDDARQALKSIREAYEDNSELVAAVTELEEYIVLEQENRHEITKMQKSERGAEQPANRLARVAAEVRRVRNREEQEKYQSAIFKCLADYNRCLKGNSRWVCKALIAICIAKQLVPFVPKG